MNSITVNGGTSGYNLQWSGPTTGNPFGFEINNNGGIINQYPMIEYLLVMSKPPG